MATHSTSNGFTVEVTFDYANNPAQKAKVDSILKALGDLSPDIAKLLKKVGYDKFRIRDGGIPFNGLTYSCPQPDEPDVDINVSNNDNVERTLEHELGHLLDDILGEQNAGKQNYSDSFPFNTAKTADLLLQSTNPNLLPSPSVQEYYNDNPTEFVADINMANSQVAAGKPDTKSSYTQMTAAELLAAYPVSANELKNQINFALGEMAAGRGPNGGYKQCPDSEWGGSYYHSKAIQARINLAKNTYGIDPLILDLDANGIETTTLDDAGFFDVLQTPCVPIMSETVWTS